MSFDKLKKNRSNSLEKLTEQLNKIESKGYSNPDEEKYWKPTRDSAGNGFAIIRFLPALADEDVPFVPFWDHGFKGPTGQWYIEKSLTTLGQPDPLSEYNSKLWNSGVESDKEQARKQKRRLHYVSNIYVIKDPANPENEGKVFLYSYGKKIFEKLKDLMNPSFEDETPVDPFDFWEGANFRLKIRVVEGYPNYDKSEFDSPSALSDDDDELEKIYEQQHSLKEVIDPKKFKTYDELQARLHLVLNLSGPPSNQNRNTTAEDDLDIDLDITNMAGKSDPEPEKQEAKSKTESVVDDDDDDMEFFKNLANS